ncbi:hypothetical protein HMPREF1863_00189 [Aedoeadaptatus coxii]|uniref:Uncharacterized protein n=1 Tax=Aedoeadaptatus coxii TaxID=755172 RepID=A0A134AKV7_9FIRM|nr:hypothetical protein HMPREF1863_00189 [Peptoniphilus coxii]
MYLKDKSKVVRSPNVLRFLLSFVAERDVLSQAMYFAVAR